jgi:hypothetical protein
MKTFLFLPFFLFCETNKTNAQITFAKPADSANVLTKFIPITERSLLISPSMGEKQALRIIL